MIVMASWLSSTDGTPIRFETPEGAFKFLDGVNYKAACLSDRRITDWYTDTLYQGGFRWYWEGDSDEEWFTFQAMWNHSVNGTEPGVAINE